MNTHIQSLCSVSNTANMYYGEPIITQQVIKTVTEKEERTTLATPFITAKPGGASNKWKKAWGGQHS